MEWVFRLSVIQNLNVSLCLFIFLLRLFSVVVRVLVAPANRQLISWAVTPEPGAPSVSHFVIQSRKKMGS